MCACVTKLYVTQLCVTRMCVKDGGCDKVVCENFCVQEEDAEEAGRGGHAPEGADLKTRTPQYFVGNKSSLIIIKHH